MGQIHQDSNRRGRGFTYVDLLVAILIVCFLSGVVFSAGGLLRAREVANRVKCAANLKQIGLAIMLYSNENKGSYPRTIFVPGEAVTQYTGVECKDPFGKEAAPKANDITAAMFLLVRTQDITSEVFICPSADAVSMVYPAGKTAQDFGNFKSEENLSYSMGNMYPDMKAIQTGYRMNATTGAEIAIVADMNPGTFGESDVTTRNGPADEKAALATMRKANSMNHRGMGQNVLYGDGHVEFEQTAFCGQKRDNIYTVSGSNDGSKTTSDTISGAPRWSGDSVLLPAATANPHKKTPDQEEMAAVKEFRAMLPRYKERLAAEEQKNGQTPQVMQMKERIAAVEKELEETEARLKKDGKMEPAGETPRTNASSPADAVKILLTGNAEAKITSTKAAINGIKTAIDVFEVDNGRFPSTAEGLMALVKQPAGLTNWHGPYVEQVQIQADAWGHPYVYRYPGVKNPNGFELHSTGPDGKESADDIGD